MHIIFFFLCGANHFIGPFQTIFLLAYRSQRVISVSDSALLPFLGDTSRVTAPPTFSHAVQLYPVPFICAKIEKILTWKFCLCCVLQWCLNCYIVKLSKDLLRVLGISLNIFHKIPKENSMFSTLVRDLFLSDVNKSYTCIYFVVKFQGLFFSI